MDDLAKTGRYQVPDEVLVRIQETFACGWASDEQAEAAMKGMPRCNGLCARSPYGVRVACFKDASSTGRRSPAWCFLPRARKFCHDVCEALGLAAPQDDFACMRELEGASERQAPAALAALENADEAFR